MKHSDYHGKLLRLAMVFVALFLCGTMDIEDGLVEVGNAPTQRDVVDK